MARRKIPYNKRATTYEEQITILRRHGVVISDEAKAREYLADIGYYRLGFYLYPFEKTYPRLDSGRSHNVILGTRIEDAVALYYFDLDLRNILHKYLSRIEVAIRTVFIYELSTKYSGLQFHKKERCNQKTPQNISRPVCSCMENHGVYDSRQY